MRVNALGLLVTLGLSALPHTILVAQTPKDTTSKPRKPPTAIEKLAKRVVDTAATAAAGAGVQSLLGKKAGGVANALGAGGASPCGALLGTSAGAAIVGAAKGIAKQVADTGHGAPAVPCGKGLTVPGLSGMANAASVNAAAANAAAAMAGAMGVSPGGAATPGANPMAALGTVASMTPIGLAAGAAPGAIKGIKGMLGGKPQDKTVMLRELGKGKLEFKQVKFIEGTAELEPGFEESLTAFAEAVALTEGTYLLYVSAESPRDKEAKPDTALARKRVAKIWTLMSAQGVTDQKVTAVTELPASLSAGRKLPKAGDTKVEIIRFEKQQ